MTHIVESYESDKKTAEIVNGMYNAIINTIKNVPLFKERTKIFFDGTFKTVVNLPDGRKLDIIFSGKDKKLCGSAGKGRHINIGDKFITIDKDGATLYLPMLGIRAKFMIFMIKSIIYDNKDKFSDENILDYFKHFSNRILKDIIKYRKTIIHELTHIYDFTRIPENISYDSKDMNKYYNNPAEFNAYLQEMFDNIDGFMNSLKERKPKKYQKFLSDFKLFYALFIFKNLKDWMYFYTYSNDKNKRKIKKRVFYYWDNKRNAENIEDK